jgi:hypothetical protein
LHVNNKDLPPALLLCGGIEDGDENDWGERMNTFYLSPTCMNIEPYQPDEPKILSGITERMEEKIKIYGREVGKRKWLKPCWI